MKDIAKGNFTLRILYEQLANLQKMGPMGQVMSMIPGLSNSGLFQGVRPACAESTWMPACTQYQAGARHKAGCLAVVCVPTQEAALHRQQPFEAKAARM